MLTADLPPPAIHSSIVSFPDRGPWGKSSYRGNCSGHIQRGLIGHFKPKHFCDPAEGGGTSRDVAKAMGVKYSGFDLREGFNLVTDKLRDRLDSAPDMIFFHPPYGEMIAYSGNMWGEPNPGDLSRCGNGDEFLNKMELALMNIYDALARGGNYSVLIGDMRKGGEYHSWQADIIAMRIGKLRNVIIKTQHNCVSDRRQYSGNFIPINHEYLMVFSKDSTFVSIGQMLLDNNARIAKRRAGTWKEIVLQSVQSLGGEATIEQVQDAVLARIDADGNNNVKAKVRQILQHDTYRRISRGRYAIAA